MSKIIFITGASRGFGKLWADAFLKRGDKVVAVVRDGISFLTRKREKFSIPLKIALMGLTNIYQ